MVSHNTLLKRALDQVYRSDHERFRLGAVIYNKNKILSAGTNSMRSAKHLHPRFYRWPGSVHAEVDAILSAKTDLEGSSIFVIRVNNSGEFMFAKPCDHCMKYIEEVGIRKVIYSKSDEEFETIFL